MVEQVWLAPDGSLFLVTQGFKRDYIVGVSGFFNRKIYMMLCSLDGEKYFEFWEREEVKKGCTYLSEL